MRATINRRCVDTQCQPRTRLEPCPHVWSAQLAAPFLQSGYVLGCLAKHAAKLHKPCWELVSTMDEG